MMIANNISNFITDVIDPRTIRSMKDSIFDVVCIMALNAEVEEGIKTHRDVISDLQTMYRFWSDIDEPSD